MFAELMPLLADRTLVLTLAKESDTQIIVNVIPKKTGEKDENPALCTPLTLTGTPEELDHELPGVLTDYVETLGKFKHSLADVKTKIDEAVKTVEAEGKKKTDEAKKAAGLKASRTAAPKADAPGEKPADTPALKADLFAGSMPPAAPAPASPAVAEHQPIRRRTTAAAPKPAPAPEPESMELEPPEPVAATGLDPDPEPPPVPEIEEDPDSCPF